MQNMKTTVTGVLSIVVAVGSAVLTFLKTGSIPDLGTLIAAVTAGVGLILAKDAPAS
jgi:hypothetical protein